MYRQMREGANVFTALRCETGKQHHNVYSKIRHQTPPARARLPPVVPCSRHAMAMLQAVLLQEGRSFWRKHAGGGACRPPGDARGRRDPGAEADLRRRWAGG